MKWLIDAEIHKAVFHLYIIYFKGQMEPHMIERELYSFVFVIGSIMWVS